MSSLYRSYFCKKCQEGFKVLLADPQLHLLKKVMRCPNSSACEGKQYQVRDKEAPEGLTPLSALKFFQACAGVGLPGERVCGVKEMQELLTGARIVDLHLEPAPDPKRSIVWSLVLDNGKTVHLASSSIGATLYKVTQKETKHGR